MSKRLLRREPISKVSWSRELKAHRLAVTIYNFTMRMVPFRIKYGIGGWARRARAPYCLLGNGSIVVQIGAPFDMVFSGRSRAVYFGILAGQKGKVVVVEPDARNLRAVEDYAKRHGITNMVLCPKCAWSEKRELKFYINDWHPASNFTEGCKSYGSARLKSFRILVLPADTIDNILGDLDIKFIDLISITTNGAEREILDGMKQTLARGVQYISLARTGDDYIELMKDAGYILHSYDDRGYTFQRL